MINFISDQRILSNIYGKLVRFAFNITIMVLLVGLFVGIVRTIMEIGLAITEQTVRLGFKELVTNVLSLIVVLELIRAFADFFEHERVRIDILIEVLIAFVIREFIVKNCFVQKQVYTPPSLTHP